MKRRKKEEEKEKGRGEKKGKRPEKDIDATAYYNQLTKKNE